MPKCSFCDAENSAGAATCAKCGAPLEVSAQADLENIEDTPTEASPTAEPSPDEQLLALLRGEED